MLKAGKREEEKQQVLMKCYVEEVASKQPGQEAIALPVEPKRAYRKSNTAYWKGKTIKSIRRKAHKQKVLYNATKPGGITYPVSIATLQ